MIPAAFLILDLDYRLPDKVMPTHRLVHHGLDTTKEEQLTLPPVRGELPSKPNSHTPKGTKIKMRERESATSYME